MRASAARATTSRAGLPAARAVEVTSTRAHSTSWLPWRRPTTCPAVNMTDPPASLPSSPGQRAADRGEGPRGRLVPPVSRPGASADELVEGNAGGPGTRPGTFAGSDAVRSGEGIQHEVGDHNQRHHADDDPRPPRFARDGPSRFQVHASSSASSLSATIEARTAAAAGRFRTGAVGRPVRGSRPGRSPRWR